MDALDKVLGGAGVVALLVAVGLGFAYGAPTALFAVVAGYLLISAGVIARDPRIGTVVTAAGCFASNAYLFSRKWEAAKGIPALCTLNSTFDCDRVNSSPYSMMFGAVPITLLGMAFFAGLAVAALSASDDPTVPVATRRKFHQANVGFAIINLLYSAFLGFHSVQMGVFCILCISIYIGNLLLLWAGISGIRRLGPEAQQDPLGALFSRDFGTISGVFVFTAFIGMVLWSSQGNRADAAKGDPDKLAAFYTLTAGNVRTDSTDAITGSREPTYTVVEFADFGCPHCAEAFEVVHRFVRENPDVQLRFKPYPLTGDCNPLLAPKGPARCQGAMAAECARQQGKFDPMSELLFANQGYLFGKEPPADLRGAFTYLADQLQLDPTKFNACLDDPAVASGVLSDARDGNDAGVMGTPTFFIKGVFPQWIEIEGGPNEMIAVITAHKEGVKLLPPAPHAPIPQ